jgi:hypothetical protein
MNSENIENLEVAEHFFYIGRAMNKTGQDGMWDEEDGFYHDVLRLPDGSATRLKVRSMVGLLPLGATTVIEKAQKGMSMESSNTLGLLLDEWVFSPRLSRSSISSIALS